jgi:NDP-sugar pyrophosphorylase family protein
MRLHVAIPMAGHSRRFKEAGYNTTKALLPVGNKLMIEHVFDMFDTDLCTFHLVINEDQVHDHPKIVDKLKSFAPAVTVTVIPAHELGPVFSVLQIKSLPDDVPLIVSYCDFSVVWDFRKFLYQIEGADGAVPAFKDFHPASFGDTFYAYMRTDVEGFLKELREKHSFTDERHKEPASAGIYYFRDVATYRYYAERQMQRPKVELPEAYVSLLFNEMVADGLSVKVPLVKKFICLGTPSDYEQFNFWYEYFQQEKTGVPKIPSKACQTTLIPMAGRGSRFEKFGYRVDKPMINLGGEPMVAHAIRSHPEQDKWIFVTLRDAVAKHRVNRIFDDLKLDYEMVTVEETTSGQAATCLLASDKIDDEAELFISSCDYCMFFDADEWASVLEDSSIDGAIWTTRLNGMPIKSPEAFAYCIADENGRIQRVVEKQTISEKPNLDPLVIGTFWFRRSLDFKVAAVHLIKNKISVNGEYYVGTSINHLLEQGRKFVIFDVKQWVSFGDPFELEVLEYWREYFYPI